MGSPRSRVAGFAALSLLLALVLLGGAPAALAQAPASQEPPATAGTPTAEQRAAGQRNAGGSALRLQRKAAAEGAVRVLVTLAADFRPEGELPPAAVANQRGSIARARAGLLRDLRGTQHRVHRLFDAVPVVAAELSAEALDAAGRSAHVRAIDEDVAVEPALATTDAIIEGAVARAAGYDGDGRMVAVLDTGVEAAHAFFGGRVVEEACFSNGGVAGSTSLCPDGSASQTGPGSAAPCSLSDCWHGTHVAGIAAGASATMSGVAAAADVMAIQVFTEVDTDAGPQPGSWTSDWMAGLQHVYERRTAHDIAAANLSLGSQESFRFDCDHHPAKTVIDNLRSVGIATVIAAGNEGHTDGVGFPACISSAVTVGASTATDVPASFTNAHPTLVDLLAPGAAVRSAVPGGGYATTSGTSMAAPQVAGALAVAGDRFRGASVAALTSILQDTGVPITDSRGTDAQHHSQPRIRLGAAVRETHRLTVEPAGAGRGTVSSSDGLIACGPRCSAATAGQTVTLSAAPFAGSGFAGWSGGCSGTGTCTVTTSGLARVVATFTASAMGNDAFASATSVGSLPFQRRQSTAAATLEGGEPTPGCEPLGKTVWHRYTPAASGDVVARAHGTSFEPVVAVYRGTSLTGLTPLGCHAGTPQYAYRDALVAFHAEAGQTYMIQVGGYDAPRDPKTKIDPDPQSGTLLLNLHEPLRPPAVPTGVSAAPGDRAATVTWQPSPTTPGTPIAGYTAFSQPVGRSADASGRATESTVTGLTNRQDYGFRVVARSAGGYSPVSASSSPITPIGTPDPPTAVGAVAGDGSAAVSWTPPDNDGGYALTGYVVRASPGGHAVEVSEPDTTTATVPGLTNGDEHTFTVVARNSAGESEESVPSATVVPAGRPDAPSGVTAAPGDEHATVSWTAPNARGSVLTGYTVTAFPGGSTQAVAGSTTSAVVAGLVNGTSYTFSVVAHSDKGDSEPSPSSEPVTPARVPDAPSPSPSPSPTHAAPQAPAPEEPGAPTDEVEPGIERLAGGNRFATAAAISRDAFAPGVPVVYVATGGNYPDALAGGAAAARRGGPVLLVTRDGVPEDTAAELARLRPAQIVVLGGAGAVSEAVASSLSGHAPVRRLAGPNRFATAAAISRDAFPAAVPVAYVATGANYPDALAGGAAAGSRGGPVLLVTRDGVPEDTAAELARLQPGEIVVLGGAGAVSDAVAARLGGHAPVRRLRGGDRFATAASVSADAFHVAETVYVATGGNYPDALAGSTTAARAGGPVLLVHGGVPEPVAAELARLRPRRIAVLGGKGAVSDAVVTELCSYLRDP